MIKVLRGTEDALNFKISSKKVIGYEDQEETTIEGVVWAGGEGSSAKYIRFVIPEGVIVICSGRLIEAKVGDGVHTYPELPLLSVKADLGFNINYGTDLPLDTEGAEGDVYFMYTDVV